DWPLTWPPRTIRVIASVKEPDLGLARPVTDIEPLPPVEPRSAVWWYVGGIVVLLVAAGGFARWRFTRAAKPPAAQSPRARALAEVRQLEAAGSASEQLPRLADVLRRFLEEHFQLAATRLTTGEFRVALERANVLSAHQIDSISEILARCDLVKFAGA